MNLAPASAAWTDSFTHYTATEASTESSAAEASPTRQWSQREAELLLIRRYDDDWDGSGSSAPDPTVVDSAIEFLVIQRNASPHTPPDSVALSPDGSIIVLWRKETEYLEAEISAPGRAEFMRQRNGGTIEHWSQSWGGTRLVGQTELQEGVWEPVHPIALDVAAGV